MFNLTPLVRNLIFVCVAVFLFQKFIGDQVTLLLSLHPIGSPYFRPYQLFTYMFVHGDGGHLFFNMLSLIFTAPYLEIIWGQSRFLMYYMITGVGAAIIYAAFEFFVNPTGGGIMLGASGALYGLLMAFGLLMPEKEIQLLFPPIPIKAKYLVFLFGALTYFTDRSGQVAHVAHFGGAFVGFLLIRVFKF
jgi:membrane associated rhomboid family serine protease